MRLFFTLCLLSLSLPLCGLEPFEIVPEDRMQIISKDPDVRLLHYFVTPQEAQHLINLGADTLKPSTVTREDGLGSMMDSGRTSSTGTIKRAQDPIIAAIEARVAAVLQCPVENIEPLQIVHYTEGQQYRPHFDYFPEHHVEAFEGSQREHTLLIYLNDLPIEAGGETVFPNIHIGVKPVKCAALYFRDMKPNGEVDPNTFHGGGPVYTKEHAKWACNVWVRNKPFDTEAFAQLLSRKRIELGLTPEAM